MTEASAPTPSTIEQQRAIYALKKVRDQTGEYGQLVKGMPAMIMANGLGQAIAFLLAKTGKQSEGAKAAEDLSMHIAEWLRQRHVVTYSPSADWKQTGEALLQAICKDRGTYQRATEETLALLSWMVKFAHAFLGDSSG